MRSFRYCSADAGLWVTLGAAVAYCAWLGWHWLPLGYTSRELAAGASRVWDIRQELTEHGRLPWWTPRYMSGYSYALQYSQGLPLLPWLALSAVANTTAFSRGLTVWMCSRWARTTSTDDTFLSRMARASQAAGAPMTSRIRASLDARGRLFAS